MILKYREGGRTVGSGRVGFPRFLGNPFLQFKSML